VIVLSIGIVKRRYQKNVTNCYIMNLAITDLLFLLFSVPLTIYLGVRNVWIFGEFICKIHIYLAHVY
jgi:predicted membrane-bound dolichyl-phosphate-mannose-protein mannosyltransferase